MIDGIWQIAEGMLVSSKMTTGEDNTEQTNTLERNLGVQPLDAILLELGIGNHDLVAKCGEGLTHKAVQRARKGRRLTPRMKVRITETLNALLREKNEEQKFGVKMLFNY